MKKQKKEISSFKMLNQLMDEGKIKNPYRFFLVYHPVYEVTVNIDVERTVDEYHIIEKYMDKLVCGYTGDKGTVTDKIYIKDRKQLYGLLGLEHQAYEVAERFFEDLLMAGHFVETKEGIRATKTAHNSIKLQKKCISSTEKQKKLFDAFTMELLPVDFYEMMHLAVEKDNINENDEHAKHAVWLNPSYISERNSVEVERMIIRYTYTNQEIIDKGLPQGYKKMQVDAEGDISLKFFPYYLEVNYDRDYDVMWCKAYRVDRPQILDGISYERDEYSDAKAMIKGLSERMETCRVDNPLCKKFPICNEGEPCYSENVCYDYEYTHEDNENFYWKVQDKQIKYLLGLDENSSFQKTVCKMIAEGNVVALTSYNAGRLLYIEKTEEQKQLLLEAVRNPECDRKKLFEIYERTVQERKEKAENSYRARKLHARKEYEDALALYLELSEEYEHAAYQVGLYYENGYGVEKDLRKALQWYAKCIDMGGDYARKKYSEVEKML